MSLNAHFTTWGNRGTQRVSLKEWLVKGNGTRSRSFACWRLRFLHTHAWKASTPQMVKLMD